MKGAPKNFESWLKIKPFKTGFRWYKKWSSDKYEKFYHRLYTLSYDPIGNLPRCRMTYLIQFIITRLFSFDLIEFSQNSFEKGDFFSPLSIWTQTARANSYELDGEPFYANYHMQFDIQWNRTIKSFFFIFDLKHFF